MDDPRHAFHQVLATGLGYLKPTSAVPSPGQAPPEQVIFVLYLGDSDGGQQTMFFTQAEAFRLLGKMVVTMAQTGEPGAVRLKDWCDKHFPDAGSDR